MNNNSNQERSNRDTLKSILLQESLIDKNASLPHLEKLRNESSIKDIYFGTGISNPVEISCGIPFDILSLLLLANRIRNKLGNGHIHHLIADNHALLNRFDIKTVKKIASEYRKVIEDIVDKIGIGNYHVYLSSEISTDKYYKDLLAKGNATDFENEYAKLEATDIQYFYKTRETLLKLGWKFKGNSNFDEGFFDQQYSNVFGDNMVPIYTASGKKFINGVNDAVPYTLSKKDRNVRLIISKDEDILKKIAQQDCSDQTMKTLQNHYNGIVRLFESATTKVPDTHQSTWQKINYINQFITN